MVKLKVNHTIIDNFKTTTANLASQKTIPLIITCKTSPKIIACFNPSLKIIAYWKAISLIKASLNLALQSWSDGQLCNYGQMEGHTYNHNLLVCHSHLILWPAERPILKPRPAERSYNLWIRFKNRWTPQECLWVQMLKQLKFQPGVPSCSFLHIWMNWFKQQFLNYECLSDGYK
jgi:hypothetical protein